MKNEELGMVSFEWLRIAGLIRMEKKKIGVICVVCG